VEHDGAIYIPVIWSTDEGQGNVSRYLDGLPRDRTVRVPCVVSSRLAGMLQRRGFVEVREWSEEMDEHVDIWERRAAL
jgi:hypothetical protein